MTKKKLFTWILVIAILGGAAAFSYKLIQDQTNKTGEPTTPTTSEPTKDPAKLQEEAESVIISDPEEASDKYEEASQIYEDSGDIDKAAENAANAAAADASIQNSAPPTSPPPSGAGPSR